MKNKVSSWAIFFYFCKTVLCSPRQRSQCNAYCFEHFDQDPHLLQTAQDYVFVIPLLNKCHSVPMVALIIT